MANGHAPIEDLRRAATADEDGSDFIVRRSFSVTVKSIDEKNRCVDVIASTDTLDCYGEVVEQDWDLDRYNKNPVVLYNHNIGTLFAASPATSLPIGYSRSCQVRAGKLEATLCFVDDKASPLAEQCWQGWLQGSLRAVSVGFNPRSVKSEKDGDREYYRLSDNELYEISVCPMGANPDAVGKSRDKAIAQLEMLSRRTNSPAAAAASEETEAMTEKEAADLRTKLEEKTVALAAADADRAKAVAQVETAKTAEVAQISAKLLERDSAIAATEAAALKTLDALVKLGVKTVDAAGKPLSLGDIAIAQAERGAKAEDDLLVKSVEDLVGVKIAPAEKDEFLELARSNKSLFEKMVAKRADLKLLGGSQLPPAPAPPASGGADPNGGGLAGAIEKAMEADEARAEAHDGDIEE